MKTQSTTLCIGYLCTILTLVFLTFNVSAQTFDLLSKEVASDRDALDNFGNALDISGDYAIVGAELEDHNLSGGAALSAAGSAYIFERTSPGNWTLVQKIIASDRSAFDQFGHAVAISGSTAIVSANLDYEDASGGSPLSFAGSVYFFERQSDGTWVETQKISASDRQVADNFGFSVDLNNNYAIIGCRYNDLDEAGANYQFDAGAAYIFERDGSGIWQEVSKLVAADRKDRDHFGVAVAIEANQAIVGAQQEDEDASGLNTAEKAGSVYVYTRNASGDWLETAKLVANDREADDNFGETLAMSGDRIIVGAHQEDEDKDAINTKNNAGSAYIFEKSGSSWSQVAKLNASDRTAGDWFGFDVDINMDYAIVGAQYENEDADGLNQLNHAGSAYVFERNDAGVWTEIQKIVADDRSELDLFGSQVAMGDQYALVGARREDETPSGGGTITDAGSVYFFRQNCPAPTDLISAIINPTKVALTWSHLITTPKYQIKGTALPSGPSGSIVVSDNLTFVGSLAAGKTYTWRVRARCFNLQVSPFSVEDTFTMPTAKAPILEDVLTANLVGKMLHLDSRTEIAQLFDLNGKLLREEAGVYALNLNDLPAGSYILRMEGKIGESMQQTTEQIVLPY